MSWPAALDAQIDAFFLQWFEMEQLTDYLEIAGTATLVLIAIELLWDLARGARRSLWEPMTNLSFLVLNKVFEQSLYGMVLIVAFVVIENHLALAEIGLSPVSWLLCLLGVDFCYYWMHRCEHRVRLLWTMHSVHHSSGEFDLSTSVRLFWFLDLSLWVFFAPLLIIGFSGPQVLTCLMVVFTYMVWVHTEKIGKLGWFDKIFNSPSAHRVHHGANRQYLDKNYAGVLLLWDHLFGSYEPEVEPVRYGLTRPIDNSNPIAVGSHELRALLREWRATPRWDQRCKLLFAPPGWRPPAACPGGAQSRPQAHD